MTRTMADASPARSQLSLSYFSFLAKRKVTPIAGATAPTGAHNENLMKENSSCETT
jgi:hypothetical protein